MTNFFRLKHSDPDFHRLFHRNNIDHYSVYTRDRSLIGQVSDTWVDEAGRYYLVVDRGSQLDRSQQSSSQQSHDKVLVPLGQFQIDYHGRQIHTEVDSAQVFGLPIVTSEGIVRSSIPHTVEQTANQAIGNQIPVNQAGVNSATAADIIAPGTRTFAPVEASAPLEGSAPLDIPHPNKDVQHVVIPDPIAPASIPQPIEQPTLAPAPAAEVLARPVQPIAPARIPARIAQEEKIRLMEERLIVNARKQKVGDVIVRKEVITEMVQVPIRREKLIVEQISPERRSLVEIDLGEGDRSAIELIESMNNGSNLNRSNLSSNSSSNLNSNISGSQVTDPTAQRSNTKAASLVPIQVASTLLAELANRPEYQGVSVRIEFTDPGLQAEYQLRWRQSSPNPY